MRSVPSTPAFSVYSRFRSLPRRSFMSNTALVTLPNSAVNAPVWNSESSSMSLFRMLMGPPVLPSSLKWLGFGTSTPSSRQSTPRGELPRTLMVLSPAGSPATPGKAVTIRAGSLMPPAIRVVSSMLMVRVLSTAMSFRARPLSRSAFTSNSAICTRLVRRDSSSTVSLAGFTSTLASRCSS